MNAVVSYFKSLTLFERAKGMRLTGRYLFDRKVQFTCERFHRGTV